MTKEKLQFELPVVFTVGPDVSGRSIALKAGVKIDPDAEAVQRNKVHNDGEDPLIKYAMLLADGGKSSKAGLEHIESIVKGIIEGETRVLVSAMSEYPL